MDDLAKLLNVLGRPWKAVTDCDEWRLCKGDRIYVDAWSRDGLFRKFATLRPLYGPAGEAYFGIPDALASGSEEELRLKLEVLDA